MRVLMLGATGKVGAPILQELLDRGHQVTAVVRDPTRLPAQGPSLQHRIGDVFDAAFLADAARGADVVVCSVALRDAAQRDRTPVALMRGVGRAAAGADARLVAMGGAGSLRTAAGVDLVDTPGFPEVAKPESLGFRAALHDLVDSAPADLVWTVVSPPPAIEIDSPRTGAYRTADDDLLIDAEGASRISVADLAVAVVDEVENPKHPRRRFAVGY
ncbi:NAD(P)-dependent oxidoreductase [Mycobacterium talmoniae]|uniref:NADH-flavin reductase n=1 Tax=Mycobacterium talmoniae TaxID=1858794 RepID=A0A1S1NR61_9MYCO|nr:NAD(P)H-binding protein [Mycobacterium talmoniae]OHV06946.1 NADH-flavin reductase [Mycobacterium talmoniae]